MRDIVESHAYNFKKEVGYDLFSQCEEIADRLRVPRPVDPCLGDIMPPLNAKYYSEIMEVHKRVKEEEGDEHPTVVKQLALEEALEELKNEEMLRFTLIEQKKQQKLEELLWEKTNSQMLRISDSTSAEGKERHAEGEGEEERPRDESAEVSDESQQDEMDCDTSQHTVSDGATNSHTAVQAAHPAPTPTETLKAAETLRKDEEAKEEQLIQAEIQGTDIDTLPIMAALLHAIAEATRVRTAPALDHCMSACHHMMWYIIL